MMSLRQNLVEILMMGVCLIIKDKHRWYHVAQNEVPMLHIEAQHPAGSLGFYACIVKSITFIQPSDADLKIKR